MHRCCHCDRLAYPPALVCVGCLVDPPAFTWQPVSGLGRLATWTIVRDAFLPSFVRAVPYVVGEVELAEQRGLRMVARVVGVSLADLHVGLAVRVDFIVGGEGTMVPVFVVAPT